jgi:hypothetical protein
MGDAVPQRLLPTPGEKRAVFAASAMIGALTMARVVTKPVLSDTILRSVEKAVSRMCQEA